MKTTSKSVRDSVKNVLDYLVEAELAVFVNEVSMTASRVAFHASAPEEPFLLDHGHPSIEQYLSWIRTGAYSAVLFDGSLLQISYDLRGGWIVGHRLHYVPCPYAVDTDLLASGEPIADVIDLYRDRDALLRSPVRFDYDPENAKSEHPAAHMTLNSVDCRIACVAPLHVLRFVDFVFRHFYVAYWQAHRTFFDPAAWRHIGVSVLADGDRRSPHMMWDVNATQSN